MSAISRLGIQPSRESSFRSCSSWRRTLSASVSSAARSVAISSVRPARVPPVAARWRLFSMVARIVGSGRSGPAQAGVGGHGGECHCLSIPAEIGAGALDAVEGARVGHPAVGSLIRVSSRVMSCLCRPASAIQPRCSASRASASASTRCAARIGSELGSARKLGQCSQIFA